MTAIISIKETSDDKRFYRVTCDLKGYRISQLNRMQEPNSRIVVEYLNSKMRIKPRCVDIAQLKRKEQSVYKPSDMWTQEDDILFLRYCPSKRDKCYHTISRDSSCRPQAFFRPILNGAYIDF